jgi:hypothetical protein
MKKECNTKGNQVLMEGIRFCGKESDFVGRNQVSLEGIGFRWKESGFVGCLVNMA